MITRPKEYIRDLMYDKRRGLASGVLKLFLLPISYLYGFLVRCHNFFYDVNVLKSHKAAGAVVSIGNITLGGTGKTPFAIMLARRLAGKTKVAVLIRGYGEDERRMLKSKLEPFGVRVFVGRDRVKAAKEAGERGARAVILDDGFQHRRLKRDLDIVLLDSASPFGNGHIFPRGILRENKRNLKRAGMIVLAKADMAKGDLSGITDEIKKIAPGAHVLKAMHRPKGLFELHKGERIEISSARAEKACIFSSIADPAYFRHTLKTAGLLPELEFIFPDHYDYRKKDLEKIYAKCRERNIKIAITTEKDAVKVRALPLIPGFRVFVLSVEIEITDGEEALNAEIHRLYMRANPEGA